MHKFNATFRGTYPPFPELLNLAAKTLRIHTPINLNQVRRTCPVQPILLKFLSIVAFEHFINGDDIAGIRRSRLLTAGLQRGPGYGGHLAEHVVRVPRGIT